MERGLSMTHNRWVIHHGQNNNGELWFYYTHDVQVPGVQISGSPDAIFHNNKIYIFYNGPNGQGELWYVTISPFDFASVTSAADVKSANAFSAPVQVPGVSMEGSPCVVRRGGGFLVLYQMKGTNSIGWVTPVDQTVSSFNAPAGPVPGAYVEDRPAAIESTDGESMLIFSKTRDGRVAYQITKDFKDWSFVMTLEDTHISGWPALAYGMWYKRRVIFLFHQGKDNNGELWLNIYFPWAPDLQPVDPKQYGNLLPPIGWGTDRRMQDTNLSGSPAVVPLDATDSDVFCASVSPRQRERWKAVAVRGERPVCDGQPVEGQHDGHDPADWFAVRGGRPN